MLLQFRELPGTREVEILEKLDYCMAGCTARIYAVHCCKRSGKLAVNRIVSIFAGFMVMLSIGVAHWLGQVDLSHMSFLWLTLFVGFNLFQMGFTGFCPLINVLKLFGVHKGACCTPSGKGNGCC